MAAGCRSSPGIRLPCWAPSHAVWALLLFPVPVAGTFGDQIGGELVHVCFWGCQAAAPGPGEGLGIAGGFSLQVAVQPGHVHHLCLLRGAVWAVQPHQPDGAQRRVLPEGLLPGIR